MRWQKYIIHPLTAFLFAFGTAKFIAHFSLIDFPFAPLLSFTVVLVSYLLISKKYDPSLSVIFFSIALVLSYKAVKLKTQPQIPQDSKQILIKNMTITAALIKEFQIENHRLPQSLTELNYDALKPISQNLKYCLSDQCSTPLPTQIKSSFWICSTPRLENDKAQAICYISDSFALFCKKNGGPFESAMP